MYKYCPNCGKELPSNVKFCPHCGFNLAQTASPSTSSEQDAVASQSTAQPTQPTEQPTQVQSYEPTQPTQATTVQGSEQPHAQYSNVTNDAYNGSDNPGLLASTRLWTMTGFKANQCMGRADYWWGYLGYAIVGIILAIIYDATGEALYYGDASPLYYIMAILYFVYSIFFGILNIFTVVQRLHDTGHSGYNWLWSLTGIGAIYVLVLIVQPTNWNKTDFPRNHYNIK